MTSAIQAVFIDRDGTHGGSDRMVYPGEFELLPGVAQSLQRLRDRGIVICSFTNQPGISAGEATAERFHKELKAFGFMEFIYPPTHTGQAANAENLCKECCLK